MILPSCLDDPIIVPDTLEARLIFYNNLLETDKVVWDINDVETISDLAYGVPAEGVVEVEDYSQQVRFDASTLDGEVVAWGL